MKKLAYLLLTLSCFSCKIAKVGNADSNQDSKSGGGDAVSAKPPLVQPQKQSTVNQKVDVKLDDSGRVTSKLTIRLDYFPTPRSDGASIPSCYQELPAHLVMGRLYCTANGNIVMDVTVSQLNQQCFTSPETKTITAKQQLVLAGCKGAGTLQMYKYEPDVKVEVQSE